MNTTFTLIGSYDKNIVVKLESKLVINQAVLIKEGITNYKKDTVNEKYF